MGPALRMCLNQLKCAGLSSQWQRTMITSSSYTWLAFAWRGGWLCWLFSTTPLTSTLKFSQTTQTNSFTRWVIEHLNMVDCAAHLLHTSIRAVQVLGKKRNCCISCVLLMPFQELADDVPNAEKLCPECTANIFSTITFTWIGALLKQGYK